MWNVIVYPPYIYPVVSYPPATCSLCGQPGGVRLHQTLPASANDFVRMNIRNDVTVRFKCNICEKTWTYGQQNRANDYKMTKIKLARIVCDYARGASIDKIRQSNETSCSRATAYRIVKNEGGEDLKKLHGANRRIGNFGRHHQILTASHGFGRDTLANLRSTPGQRHLLGETLVGAMFITVEVWPVYTSSQSIETVRWMKDYLNRFSASGIFTYKSRVNLERKINIEKTSVSDNNDFFAVDLLLTAEYYNSGNFIIQDNYFIFKRAVLRALNSYDESKRKLNEEASSEAQFRNDNIPIIDIDRIFYDI